MCPQGKVTGTLKSSRQMEHTSFSSSFCEVGDAILPAPWIRVTRESWGNRNLAVQGRSQEAGQSSEPGMLLKETPSGCTLTVLAMPHAWKMMGRFAAAPLRERKGCEVQQKALERMKHCSNTTGRQMQVADKHQSNVYFGACIAWVYISCIV